MSWISIDYEKCGSCSKCIYACSLRFLKPANEMAVSADATNCNLCGHCAAVCPEGAIVHRQMNMDNFEKITRPIRFDTDEFVRFIRQRRSHRHFRNKPIARPDLEKLIDAIRYAPTGGNAQSVELIVAQDPQKIKQWSDLTVDHLAEVSRAWRDQAQPLAQREAADDQAGAGSAHRLKFFSALIKARDEGFDPVFYDAPAVAVFHSTTQTVTPKDNCVIAATTMGMLARTMGLETTYIALFEHAAKAYLPLVAAIDLPTDHQVYSVLVLGYPRLEFRTTVDRKPIPTRWE